MVSGLSSLAGADGVLIEDWGLQLDRVRGASRRAAPSSATMELARRRSTWKRSRTSVSENNPELTLEADELIEE